LIHHADRSKRQFYFDISSHLLRKESGATGGVTQEILIRRLIVRKMLLVLPKTRTAPRKRDLQHCRHSVSVNQSIGERVFDFPIKSQVRLPDLKNCLRKLTANQKAADKNKRKLPLAAFHRRNGI